VILQEEVLRAIIQSGDKLTAEEEKFMNQISAKNSSFVQVADNAGNSPQFILFETAFSN